MKTTKRLLMTRKRKRGRQAATEKYDAPRQVQFAHGHTITHLAECRTLCRGCQNTLIPAQLGVLVALCDECRPKFLQLTRAGRTAAQALAELAVPIPFPQPGA